MTFKKKKSTKNWFLIKIKSKGIAQGFIKSIRNNNTLFTLLVDKNFNSSSVKISKEHLFRIDKINFRSAISLNYNNLARLMNSEDKCQQLRALIIDKANLITNLIKQIN